MPRYTTTELETALHEARGMLWIAAKRLGCSPNTIKARLAESAALQEAVAHERGMAGDTAELKLYQAVQNGEAWAITFYLRTIGKDRGYVERQEFSGPSNGPIEVKHSVDDASAILLADLLAAGLTARSSNPGEGG